MITRRTFLGYSAVGGLSVLGPSLLNSCDSKTTPKKQPQATAAGPNTARKALARPNKWWLEGNYAPVADEVELTSLDVVGTIPPSLDGLYLRNGPNPKSGTSRHWFVGDGMVHGVRLQRGKATWYRNRYVKTRLFTDPGGVGLIPDLFHVSSNTSVIYHGKRLLSLVEVGVPYELSPKDLSTIGAYDFGGRLKSPMTAHPKIDPVTGEMFFFGYWFRPPYLTFHQVDKTGALVRSETIDVPGATMMHDFQVTENYVLFLDLPVVFDMKLAMSGGVPYVWKPSYGARIGVMPRTGSAKDVRWLDIDPCYVFHTTNAYEASRTQIVLDAVRHRSMFAKGLTDGAGGQQHWRWTIDLKAGTVNEAALDDRIIEFPSIDPRRAGRSYRYSYAAGYAKAGMNRPATYMLKYDRANGSTTVHPLQSGVHPDEAIFVPASAKAAEDEGWLFTFVYRAAENQSELWIVNANQLTQAPAARIKLARRVPHGFHGTWIPSA